MHTSPFDAAVPQVSAHEPAALTLDDPGTIRDCNERVETIFDFACNQLIVHHISRLLPQFTGSQWLLDGRPNPHLQHLFPIGYQFNAVTCDGQQFGSKLFLIELDNGGQSRLRLITRFAEEA